MALTVLLVLLFLALLIATYRDVKTREVPDTLTYGLITVGLLGSLAAAIITKDLWLFLEHLFGFLAGLAIGLVMFYARQWGGGDAKLLMGVGAILGFSLSNLQLVEFFILLILCGALYGLAMLLYLAFKHRKVFVPEFKKYIRTPAAHRLRITLVLIGVAVVIAVFFVPPNIKILFGFILLGLYLLVYSWMFLRIIEKHILTKEYPVTKLTEGDWVAQTVKVGKRVIITEKNTGITPEQIAQLKKAKVHKVLVKEGIAFVPGFLLAFLVMMIIHYALGESWFIGLFV